MTFEPKASEPTGSPVQLNQLTGSVAPNQLGGKPGVGGGVLDDALVHLTVKGGVQLIPAAALLRLVL